MAEDSDKNPGKIIKDGQKAQKKSQSDIASGTTATAEGIKSLTKKTEEANKKQQSIFQIAKGRETVDELRYNANLTGDNKLLEQAEALEKKLGEQEKYLNMSNDISESHNDRLKEIEIINRSSDDLLSQANEQRKFIEDAEERRAEQTQKRSDDFAKQEGQGFKNMVDTMKANTKSLELSDDIVTKAILDLGPTFAGEVDPFFKEATDRLDEIKELEDNGLITQKTANDLRQELLDATTNREKEREAQEAAELQAMALTQLGDKFSRVGEKIGEFGKGAVKGAGLLGGLIALVMGVVDPELFAETVIKLTTGFTDIIAGILAFFSGDYETAKTKIGDNILLFGGVILGLALYFGGPLISAFGGIFTKLAKVVRAIKIFKVFMMGPFATTMIASLTSMGTMMGFAAGSLGVVLAPVIAIVAVIGLLYAGFKALNSSLGPGASIMDTLKVGMLYFVDFLAMIVNGITFIPRKILGFLGPRLMKWIMGDDFDTSTIDNLAKGFETNRGAQAAEEIKLKNEKAAAQKAMEEELNPDTVLIPENTTGMDLQMSGEDLEAAQLAMGSGGGTQVNAPQINTQASATTNSSTTINHSVMSEAALSQAAVLGRA